MSQMIDNTERSRFELLVDGLTVLADYRRQNETLVITHVEAPMELRGTGAAGRLMLAIAGHAQEQGLTIRPLCGYAASWLRRHKEYSALVA